MSGCPSIFTGFSGVKNSPVSGAFAPPRRLHRRGDGLAVRGVMARRQFGRSRCRKVKGDLVEQIEFRVLARVLHLANNVPLKPFEP